MKKAITLMAAGLFAAGLFGQAQNFAAPGKAHRPVKAFARPSFTGFEEATAMGHPGIPPSSSGLRTVDDIGWTYYDLQSNASDISHLVNLGGGDLRSVWTFNKIPGDGGFADRGTAYTRTSGGVFPNTAATQPKERIEGIRTGFCNLGVFDDGTEIVVSHRSNGTGKFLLHYAKRAAGATTWTEGDIPTNTPNGLLWCRTAVSGSTIHVIGITSPTATNVGGVLVDGFNGKFLYFRSKDKGVTWDIVDQEMPDYGLDKLDTHNAESYFIDASGSTVAVGIFPYCSDVRIWKSTDNGDNWASRTIYKFPIKNFTIGDGYDETQIDTAYSTKPDPGTGPDLLAVWSSDEHGSLRIDAAGVVHALFGGGFLNASEANTTGAYTYYPSSGGLNYWNDAMPDDDSDLDGFPVGKLIAQAIDYNANGGIDIDTGGDAYNGYGGCFMASQPTMGLGPAGSLYVAYLAADERYLHIDQNQAFSHVHIIKSTDGGDNWAGPYDVLNPDNFDPVEIELTETAFPYLARNCSDKVHLVFEQDYVVGSFVSDNASAAPSGDDITSLRYLGLDPAEIQTVSGKDLAPEAVSVEVSPNPASEALNVELSFLKKAESCSISVFDIHGKLVFQQNKLDAATGRTSVPVWQLANGPYSLTVRTEQGAATRKFVVMH